MPFCTRCGKEIEVAAPICRECHEQIAYESQSYNAAPQEEPVYQPEQGEYQPAQAEYADQTPAAANTGSGIGAILLKWGLIIGGGFLLMAILSKVMGVYAGLIGGPLSIIILVVVLMKVHKYTYIILGLFAEFYAARNARPGFASILWIAISVAVFVFVAILGFGVSAGMIPLLTPAGIAIAFLAIRFKRDFLKVLFLQLALLPVLFARMIFALFGRDRRGANVTSNGFGHKTRWIGVYPDVLSQDGWLLEFIGMCLDCHFYGHADGTVCLVQLAFIKDSRTGEGHFDITPVYNRNTRPKWAAWLF